MVNPLQRPATTPVEKLARAVDEYLKEVDNPAPDYSYRHTLRERLRKALAGYQDDKT